MPWAKDVQGNLNGFGSILDAFNVLEGLQDINKRLTLMLEECILSANAS